MSYIIVGVIVAILGVVFWMFREKKKGKSNKLELFETSSVAEITENYQSIRNSMGEGAFKYDVEVKGKAHTETPLKAPFSLEPVLYFKSIVTHEYEKLTERRDKDGNIKMQWIKYADVVSENERYADGTGVKDSTGFITVNPKSANLYTEKIVDRFEKGNPQSTQSGVEITMGSFSMKLGNTQNGDIKTIGYRYLENGIRQNAKLYVVGEANDRDGKLEISKPQEKEDLFIFSTRTKEEVLGNLGGMIKGYTIGAFVCWCAAVALIVVGITQL